MVESRNRERRPGNAPGLGWALVVVLVPQAILTTQHAEEFKAANLASTEVRACVWMVRCNGCELVAQQQQVDTGQALLQRLLTPHVRE